MSYRNPQFLTSAESLGEQLTDPDLRIVDATVFLRPAATGYLAESGLEAYRQGHVPGAVFMDLIEAFSDRGTGLGFSLPGPQALAASLGELGISERHRVVAYSSGHVMWATRAWWLLRYCGHERVAVLDGGLRAWKAAGLPLGTDEPAYPAVAYRAAPRDELFVGLEAVRDAIGDPGVCTVNALSPEVYAGTGEVHYGRRGHIPGSLNLHYDELLRDGMFKGADELREILTARGLLDADRVISYCGGGISATIDAFACQLVGKEGVAVYDGSMSEWARDDSLPLTTGSEP